MKKRDVALSEDFFSIAAGWISPRSIVEVAASLRESADGSCALQHFAWQPIKYSFDPVRFGLRGILDDFLARFRLRSDLLDLTAALMPGTLDKQTIIRLQSLRFKGRLQTPADPELPSGATIGFVDAWPTAMLLVRPLTVIVNKTMEIVTRYCEVRSEGDHQAIMFEHAHADPFTAEIDYIVSRSLYGNRLLPHPFRSDCLLIENQPSVNVVCRTPIDDDVFEVARALSRQIALSHYTVFGKGLPNE